MKPQHNPKLSPRRPPMKVGVGAARRRALDHVSQVPAGRGGRALPRHLARTAQEYALLAREHIPMSVESAEILGLALWGYDSAGDAFVLLRGSVIALSNRRFHELARQLDGSRAWQRLDDAEASESSFASLEQLVQHRAAVARAVGEAPAPVRFLRQGRDQVIEVRSEPAVAPGDRSVLVIVRDVTEVVRMEQEIAYARRVMADQERVRLLGEVTSGITHDLKNMLGAMGMRLASMPAAASQDGRCFDVLRRIVDDGMAILGRLQEFARRGVMDPPIDRVDVCQAVRDALEMVETELRHDAALGSRPGVRVETALPELPPVRGAAVELRQLFMNLLLNARDALDGHGRILIAAVPAGDCVVVTVEDDGPGIPEPLLQKIFLPFFSTKGDRGTGLGLYTAANTMKRLGGSITAQNRHPRGAHFKLTFPLADVRAGEVLTLPAVPAPSPEPVIGSPPVDVPPRRAPATPPATQLQLSPTRNGPRTL